MESLNQSMKNFSQSKIIHAQFVEDMNPNSTEGYLLITITSPWKSGVYSVISVTVDSSDDIQILNYFEQPQSTSNDLVKDG